MLPASRLLPLLVFLIIPQGPLAAEKTPAPNPEAALLNSQFETKIMQEAQQPYDAAIARLNASYVSSLERALDSAQKSGSLDDAVALKAERKAVGLGQGVPVKDDPATPTVLKQLRENYRGSISRLEAERAKKIQPLKAALLDSLETLISRLTKEGRLDDAMAERQQRDAAAVAVAPHGTRVGQPSAANSASSHVLTKARLVAKPWVNHVPTDKQGAAIYTFRADKTMTSTKNGKVTKGAWSIKEGTLRIEIAANKFWSEYSLELEPIESGVAIREPNSSRGKRPDTTLTQTP
jgi:hypothetical protein